MWNPCDLSPRWKHWGHACLLPLVYGEHQAAHTRCPRRKARLVQALEAVRAAFDPPALTQRLAPPVLADGHAWATARVNVLQRASSAVVGYNGSLSHMQHNQRGWPKRRYKVWIVLHNFDCRATDGMTPAARFFRRGCPDRFETVLVHVDDLPRPRQRHQIVALRD